MVFCIVTGNNLDEMDSLPECDLIVTGFGALGEVDYERELKGETEKFEEVARYSKKFSCGIFSACKTVSRGLVRKSCAVADRGKLLGISDMTHVLDGEEYKSGATLGLYKVNGYKIGLCIENDLLFPDTIKSLSLCGCNAVVALMEEVRDNIPPLLVRAYSYLYGVPVVLCAGNTAYFADISGAIATSTQKYALFEVSPQSRYHVVTTRVKGISADDRQDY